MKKTRIAVTLACIIPLSWSANLLAQDEAPPPPSFAAIDAYLCNYADGKNRGDLDKVVAKWNKWMDDTGGAPYSAWVMTPVFSSVNMTADVVWLGVWQNGNDMGQGLQDYMDGGAPVDAEFNKVISCGEHSNAASVSIRPPAEGWPGAGGVAAFTNCTVAEGKTMPDAMAVHNAWAQHLDATGSKAGMWAFFPGAGQNNPEWDYKIVVSHPDFVSYGADWENYTNGQGWAKAMEIGAGVISCDSPRVYQSTTVRDGGVNPVPQ